MTLDEFAAENIGKGIDFDWQYGNQCMDLIEEYNKQVVGAPQLGGNARDQLINRQPQYYDQYPDTLFYIPPRGAIAVFRASCGGGFGHVAIVLEANLMSLITLDQNYPTGRPVIANNRGYGEIESFLVPKVGVVGLTRPTGSEVIKILKAKAIEAIQNAQI